METKKAIGLGLKGNKSRMGSKAILSAEKGKVSVKHLNSEISNVFGALEKNLDQVDLKLRHTIENNRDVVLNAMKGKLYNIQKEIRDLEEKTEKEAIQRRIDEEIRMLTNDIEQIRLESSKLDDHRRSLDTRLKKLRSENRILDEEDRFLSKQIERAQATQKMLEDRVAKIESGNASITLNNTGEVETTLRAEEHQNVSQLSVSNIIPPAVEHQSLPEETKEAQGEFDEELAVNESISFVGAKLRYLKRIRLLERQIEELKMDNRSPVRKHQQVRTMNPVEEAFDECVTRVRGEVARRRSECSQGHHSMKLSRSQPSIHQKDISVQAGETTLELASHREFTDSDKISAIESFFSKPKVREFIYKLLFPDEPIS